MQCKYTKVRNDFIERGDLDAAEKLILVYLYGRMRRDGQPWEVNREQIADALGMGVHAVRNALASLREGGWITDNRKAVQGERGRIRREKACVVESRRREIVAPDAHVSAGRTEGRKPTYGQRPSNEELSMKNIPSADESAPKEDSASASSSSFPGRYDFDSRQDHPRDCVHCQSGSFHSEHVTLAEWQRRKAQGDPW